MTESRLIQHPRFWFAACFMAFFLLGSVQAAYGPLLPVYQQRGIPVSALGLLVSLHAAGAIAGIHLGGCLARKWSAKGVLLLFAAPFVAGLLWMALANSGLQLQGAALLAGLGFGGFDVGLQLISMRFLGPRPASSMNLLAAGFGSGAFFSPFVVATTGSNPQWIYGALTALALALLLVFTQAADQRPAGQTETRSTPTLPSLSSKPFLALFFLYSTFEIGITTWSGLYLAPLLGTSQAAAAVSLFWIFFLIGRLLFSALSKRIPTTRLLVALCMLAVAAAALSHKADWHLIIFPILGLALGPIFPTAIAWVGMRFGADSRRVIPAGLLLSNGAGIAVAPIAGFVVTRFGADFIPYVNVAFSLTCLAIVISVSRIVESEPRAA